MNIDKMKTQHDEIIHKINQLREYSRDGVSTHAQEIAQTVVSMSSVIKVHLSAEDQFLYPFLEKVEDQTLRTMSLHFQREMADIVVEYEKFSRRWNTASKLMGQDETFRRDANSVLRKVHERMQRENHQFYPRVEQL
ncbi:hemerythrin domain-containing protein [Atlantibacter hermannii]|uniref:hemerythrin domain-containing protein n=1 Tax=Atlantibacter hermannii TaxID=565 RepID=UPI0028AB3220|nr:hemerythrin domain-containing protein [Atlantibacter hermannii]